MDLEEAMGRIRDLEIILEGALDKIADLESLIEEVYRHPGVPDDIKDLLRPDDTA